ncbi:MAG: hypothetical protein EOM03_11930, partial [Clostridia bacterium]|nr:hypothetical protein [Clostridia bacterium]
MGPGTGRVFLCSQGRPYNTQAPNSFRDVVEELGLNEGRAKLDRIVFHSLRHSGATRLGQSGVPLLTAYTLWRFVMLELTKRPHTKGVMDICLRVPAGDVERIAQAIQDVLNKSGDQVREINDEGEELFSVEEVFPDSTP